MADDELVQPLSQPESPPPSAPSSPSPSFGGGGGSAPSEPTPGGSSYSEPSSRYSPHDDDSNAYDPDDYEIKTKSEKFDDVFDFLVGINPERVVNTVASAIDEVVEAGWTKAAMTVRGALGLPGAPEDKGHPADIPRPSPQAPKGKAAARK